MRKEKSPLIFGISGAVIFGSISFFNSISSFKFFGENIDVNFLIVGSILTSILQGFLLGFFIAIVWNWITKRSLNNKSAKSKKGVKE